MVLGLAAVALSLPLAGAESTGIIISKEGSDVNVAIDTTRYPDLKIKRNDGKMIIEVPDATKSDASRMMIDSALKKSGLVSVSETGTGKIVTVNSQDVYLSIQDLTETTLEDKPSKSEAVRPATKAAPVPSAPKVSVEKPVAPSARPVEAPKQPAAKAATAPVASERPSVGNTVHSRTAAPAPSAQAFQGAESILKAKSASNEALEPSSQAAGTAAEPEMDMDPAAVQTEALPSVIRTAEDSEAEAITDPESVPISMLEAQRQKLSGESTGILLRLVAGLIVVLGLAIAFMKLVLPRLVEKYPDFFEKLRRKNSGDPYELADMDAVGIGRFKSREAAPFDDLAPPPPKKPSFFEQGTAEKPGMNFLTRREPSKKQYLEHLKMGDETLTVLTSTKLGKGKELHLVEVKGRELVIATTPYTVTLVADLSKPDAEPDAGWQPEDDTEKTSSTRAYLEEHAGRNPAVGQPSQSLNKRFSSLQNHENLYRKYLDDEKAGLDKTRRQPPPFVDAEEVVVLEDYDDIYRA